MTCYQKLNLSSTHGALINQSGAASSVVADGVDGEPPQPTAAQSVISFLKKSVSSVVVFSYLSLTVGQSYAMDGNKVVPFDGHEGIALKSSHSTPKKFSKHTVVSVVQGSPNSVAGVLDVEKGKGSPSSTNSLTDDVQQERKVSDPSSLRDTEETFDINVKEDASLTDPLAAFGKAFELDDAGLQLMDLFKSAYLAVSLSMDSVINAPWDIANAGIWLGGSAKKLWNRDAEMPGEEAYYSRPNDFYRDNNYYGGHKDKYMQSLLTTILFGSVVYSINAKAKFAGYTIFDAMAKKAEMYELLYYQHADNPYYYQDQFMDGMFIYSWIALPFFLLFESSELSKILWPTREEARLKESHGFYTEHALNFLSIGIAFAAGYFAYSAYYTAAAGLLGTPQTTEKDLTTYPAFLGYSTALTMYTIARKGSDNAYRYLSRQQYGDKSGRERGMNEDAIVFYQKSMNKKFKSVKVSPEGQPSADAKLKIADGVDLEAQKRSVQKKEKRKTVFESSDTIEELETRLASLTGTELLTEVLDYSSNHKPVVERHKSHDLAALAKIREQSDASFSTQFVQGAYNSAAWVGKNSWWIVPAIVCTALVYPSFSSCVELVQWSIKGDPHAVSDYVLGQQAALKYEILSSHEDEILADPVKWQIDCFDSMKISANVTDDENSYAYYYESVNNQTADYFLHFTALDCFGIDPKDPWIAAPKDLNINYDNAVMWFYVWKNGYASYADPQQIFSTTTNILANIAAGIYTPAVYGLSVLGASFILYQGAEILVNPELTVCSKALSILGSTLVSTPAFTQGIIESASQGIEGYLALDGEFNDWAVYTCTGLITAVSALILTPDFYSVQEKIINKLGKLFYGRSAQKELSRRLDKLSELNDSAESGILKLFYKSYER